MRQRVLLALVVLLAVCGPSSGQILGTGVTPTFEVSPMAGNAAVTAIQSTISAVQSVLQTGYQVLEITPLDDIALSGEFLETMATLGAIAAEGEALMGDAEAAAQQFGSLFHIENPAHTPLELQTQVNNTMLYIAEARNYAVRTQTLINHINGAVTHVTRIVQLIGVLSGNMQGNQLLIQLQAQANQTLATQTLQQAAAQRIRTFEGAQRDVVALGWNKIQHARWEGWPTSGEGGL